VRYSDLQNLTISRFRSASAVCIVYFCAAAGAQTGAVCPSGQKLTLDDVVQAIQHHLPEERRVELLESCQVNFSLDGLSLERLASAGVSDREREVLNSVTAAQLSLEQAQAEVAGLERSMANADKSVAAERDAALSNLNAEFQAKRMKAAVVEPKGQFETTAEYNERDRQSKAEVASLGARHEYEAEQLTAEFAARARQRSRAFQERIAFLKRANYPELLRALNPTYDADSELLTATIGGEVYLFDRVAPGTAKQVVSNWKEVTVARPFTEDEMKTRVLGVRGTQMMISGQSRQAKIAGKLEDARYRAKRGDFAGALESYQGVLTLDPVNQIALEGEKAMQLAHLGQITWRDPATGLVWPRKDNGSDVNWQQAIRFCRTLTLGGYLDWRLPTIDELAGIYDRTQNVNGAGIKGGIEMTDWTAWSSSLGRSSGEVMLLFFHDGTRNSYRPEFSGGGRALCVRGSEE